MKKHNISVAAEAYAAALFAQAGYNVFVQYGANQPGFDLLVSNNSKTIHVSVKGSSNGEWKLADMKAGQTYQLALDKWMDENKEYVFCLVQFQGVNFGTMPRVYLARGTEVGTHLKTACYGNITLNLVEYRAPKRGKNIGKTEQIPDDWKMTDERIELFFKT